MSTDGGRNRTVEGAVVSDAEPIPPNAKCGSLLIPNLAH